MLRLLRSSRKIAAFCNTFDTQRYGSASKIGGASIDSLYDQYAGTFYNKELEDYKKQIIESDIKKGKKETVLPGVTIVTTPDECRKCVDVLMKTDTIVAWDTETMDLDVKRQAPVGKGKIICASFFAGPQYNFGRGPRVFIDNFGKNAGLIDYFKPYLQSEKHLKSWHNYGFDRHIFYNHGINVKGFGGDTMHMARLLDSGKMFGKYSLASLTQEYQKYITPLVKSLSGRYRQDLMKEINHQNDNQKRKRLEQQIDNIDNYLKDFVGQFKVNKTKMEEIFKRKRVLKSGGEGVSYEYPNTLTLHTNKEHLPKWIHYSVLDSESTFYLRETLQRLLKREEINLKDSLPNMWELYLKHWLPFGQILTEIQREGIKLDIDHMNKIESEAKQDLKKKQEYFINFLSTFQKGKNIDHFNLSSTLQLQQLLYAPYEIVPITPEKKQQKAELSQEDESLMNEMADLQKEQTAYEGDDKKIVRKPVDLSEFVKAFKVENLFGTKPKFVEMQVMGLGMKPYKFTPLGLPSVEFNVLEELAGNPQKEKYGKAYDYFAEKGNPKFGMELCHALKVLIEHRTIETLLKNFIEPLGTYTDANGRIHCSLNINTETGRLSCRKPNLQNQPALDKDIYKIRKAFVAEKGKKFIVADYGQLQLRVLAHLTNCKAMINAFIEGGDFHSRTAIGMYPYIRKDLEDGNILLQWDKSKGKAPVPLLKDKYAAERKKAKTVNFSIAYGKSARGFAEDWGCTLQQAEQVIKSWFSDRPQVQQWQEKKQKIAMYKFYTQTLLGRFRRLQKFFRAEAPKSFRGMGLRRAINTPIQGGAADIVIASMIKIAKNKRLKELGWKLLLQIHDQLILEGPEESSAEAFQLVKHDMQHPFEKDLLVALEVDAKIGNNWYECK